jgi:hypothetical protein
MIGDDYRMLDIAKKGAREGEGENRPFLRIVRNGDLLTRKGRKRPVFIDGSMRKFIA